MVVAEEPVEAAYGVADPSDIKPAVGVGVPSLIVASQFVENIQVGVVRTA